MNKPQKTPLEVLIDAKLAGTDSPSFVPMTFTYIFRDNEQAAKIALLALEQAGYKIVPIQRTFVEPDYKNIMEKLLPQKMDEARKQQ